MHTRSISCRTSSICNLRNELMLHVRSYQVYITRYQVCDINTCDSSGHHDGGVGGDGGGDDDNLKKRLDGRKTTATKTIH